MFWPHPEYEKCKKWLEKSLPNEFAKLELKSSIDAAEPGGETAEEEKKRQKRGGKGMIKANKKKEDSDVNRKICVSRAPRGKKKSVTVVTGMLTFGVDLKVAAKFFGTKFACGSSVTGDDEIVIQGDVKGERYTASAHVGVIQKSFLIDDLFDVIPEKWPEIDEDSIDDLGDQKR